MAHAKRLIVGLGNPGPEYEGTRHNVGFAVADAVAAHAGIEIRPAGLLERLVGSNPYVVGWGRVRGYEFGLARPTTFMNRSGAAVERLLRKTGLEPRDMLVVTDDLNLPVGALRLRERGGAGGHNGLQDIIDALDTEDFPRLRIGIGNDFPRGEQAAYVLSPFPEEEQPLVRETLLRARDAALAFVTEGVRPAMDRFNRRGG